jgi:hypothetical protein
VRATDGCHGVVDDLHMVEVTTSDLGELGRGQSAS